MFFVCNFKFRWWNYGNEGFNRELIIDLQQKSIWSLDRVVRLINIWEYHKAIWEGWTKNLSNKKFHGELYIETHKMAFSIKNLNIQNQTAKIKNKYPIKNRKVHYSNSKAIIIKSTNSYQCLLNNDAIPD